jgi:hypothetical protein
MKEELRKSTGRVLPGGTSVPPLTPRCPDLALRPMVTIMPFFNEYSNTSGPSFYHVLLFYDREPEESTILNLALYIFGKIGVFLNLFRYIFLKTLKKQPEFLQ